jgi:hypothetical protein
VRQALGRQELVVRGEQGVGAVQHADAALPELRDELQAGLDAVERGEDVEARDRDVVRAQDGRRLLRPEDARVEAALPPGVRELDVRSRRPRAARVSRSPR